MRIGLLSPAQPRVSLRSHKVQRQVSYEVYTRKLRRSIEAQGRRQAVPRFLEQCYLSNVLRAPDYFNPPPGRPAVNSVITEYQIVLRSLVEVECPCGLPTSVAYTLQRAENPVSTMEHKSAYFVRYSRNGDKQSKGKSNLPAGGNPHPSPTERPCRWSSRESATIGHFPAKVSFRDSFIRMKGTLDVSPILPDRATRHCAGSPSTSILVESQEGGADLLKGSKIGKPGNLQPRNLDAAYSHRQVGVGLARQGLHDVP